MKVGGFAHYLVDKTKTIEFIKPAYVGKRNDTDILGKMILAIGYKEWKEMGLSKGTHHYIKKM